MAHFEHLAAEVRKSDIKSATAAKQQCAKSTDVCLEIE